MDIKFSDELKTKLMSIGVHEFKDLIKDNATLTKLNKNTLATVESFYLIGFITGVMAAAHLILDNKIEVIKKPINNADEKTNTTTTEEAELSI